ncbi:hypothetical protein [Niallia sp. RD1]|nr:hypothetical protein [Niallia sp. RD1]
MKKISITGYNVLEMFLVECFNEKLKEVNLVCNMFGSVQCQTK